MPQFFFCDFLAWLSFSGRLVQNIAGELAYIGVLTDA